LAWASKQNNLIFNFIVSGPFRDSNGSDDDKPGDEPESLERTTAPSAFHGQIDASKSKLIQNNNGRWLRDGRLILVLMLSRTMLGVLREQFYGYLF
jgi:hypothetical protein